MGRLVLIRHGESRWNVGNKFTGWVDVPLSPKGVDEAVFAADKLKEMKFDVAFTSMLKRAQVTLTVLLSEQNRTGIFINNNYKHKWMKYSGKLNMDEIPIFQSVMLNERYYGVLQGMDKDQARQKFGEDNVLQWRRSFDIAPPEGESLKDVHDRVNPYFIQKIWPQVVQNKNVLLVAHGNTLRALIKELDGIDSTEIPHLNLPFAQPIIYEYDGVLKRKTEDLGFDRPLHWKINEYNG